jgi:(p)ppGpp synthase/HD superfamily hydrolase
MKGTLIERAIRVAYRAHRNQVRKGTQLPYTSHPLAVGILLLRLGRSDEAVAAAILHDTVEDTELTLDDIRSQFGETVAEIVKGCSEPDKSLPWEERKAHTIEFLKTAPLDVRLVSCADKLHNLRETIEEYERSGEELWRRFRRGREKQAWYYREVTKSLCDHHDDYPPSFSMCRELREAVDKLFDRN